MNRAINFVRDRRKKLTEAQEQDQIWFVRASIGLGCTLGLVLVVFGVRSYMFQQVSAVQAQQDQTRQQILAQEETERSFVIGVNKVKILTDLFQERRNKQQAIDYFSSVFGPAVLVRQISFNTAEQLLTFRLQADDVFVLEEVFQQLESDDIITQFQNVASSNLRRNDEGKYEMTVAVTLGQEAADRVPEETPASSSGSETDPVGGQL